MHKELAVALGTGDRRIDPAEHLACRARPAPPSTVVAAPVDERPGRVITPLPAVDLCLAGLELRFDQQDECATRAAHSQ